jgi:DNA-binding beta-propeller fold protein YncE
MRVSSVSGAARAARASVTVRALSAGAWCRAGAGGLVVALALLLLPASASATFTSLGSFSGTFHSPGAIAIVPSSSGAAQDVYVAEDTTASPGDDVLEFTPAGTLVGSIASTFTCQESTETFDGPAGVAVDPATGDLFVADNGDNRVLAFNSSRQFIGQIGGGELSLSCGVPTSPDATNTTPGSFSNLHGLSVGDGRLFVAQPGPDNGSGGNPYVDEVPLPLNAGDLRTAELGPAGAFGQAVYDPDNGNVYAADSAPNNIDVYTPGGTLITTWGMFDGGTEFGVLNPQWIAIDPLTDVLYVSDLGSGSSSTISTVYTFDVATGAYLQTLTLPDSSDPVGIAVDPINHVLYVALSGDNSVERFSYTPAPTCAPRTAGVSPGTSMPLALSCADQALAPTTYAVATAPTHGTLSGLNSSTGAVTYTPNPGYSGPDSFTYTGMSVNGTSQPASVTLDVGPPPTCAPETVSTSAASPLAVTLACSGSAATPAAGYQIVSGPSHGTLSPPSSTGVVTYTPSVGFSGSDSFTYEGLSAGGTAGSPETVTIYVATALPAPVQLQSANVVYASGSVTILLPGQQTPIPLVAGMQVPLGSVVDATDGRVEIYVANQDGVQHADFYSGKFSLEQSVISRIRSGAAKATPLFAVLDLLGSTIPVAKCTGNAHSVSGRFSLRAGQRDPIVGLASVHEAHKPVRQLWGSGHGNFTLVGNGSSSSVRGTTWAIFDYPDGTLTRVYTDSVSVEDFATRKSVVVRAGHFYFSALAKLKPCR